MLQVMKNDGLGNWGNVNPPTYWQFQPVDGQAGRYAVRNSRTALNKQLATCFNAQEVSETHTQPCLVRSDGGDYQKWEINVWPGSNSRNATYRFQNLQNGTKLNMDVHPGNPLFMSNDQGADQKAQHWLMTSVSKVNDAAYSTVFTDVPSTTASATPTATTSASASGGGGGGLSGGAIAGIVIGVVLAIILAAVGGFLVYRRRRRGGKTVETEEEKHGPTYAGNPTYEMHHNPVPQEMETTHAVELDATESRG